MMSKQKLYTFGYTLFADKTDIHINRMFHTLKALGVTHLIDVRSFPYSKKYPQCNANALKEISKQQHIPYGHMEELGAKADGAEEDVFSKAIDIFYEEDIFPIAKSNRPEYEELHACDEILDFKKFRDSSLFLCGIKRIEKAYNGGFTLAIMCSEKRPVECHRFFLVGAKVEELLGDRIEVCHLVAEGERADPKLVSNGNLYQELKNCVLADLKIQKLHIQDRQLNFDMNTEGIYGATAKIDKYSGATEEEKQGDFCERYWNLLYGWKRNSNNQHNIYL